MRCEPGLCGGITDVLHVYEEHAAVNKHLDFDELDLNGSKIDKVRAGFILEEVCSVCDPRMASWLELAALSGSRKLNAASDYGPQFFKPWMLSNLMDSHPAWVRCMQTMIDQDGVAIGLPDWFDVMAVGCASCDFSLERDGAKADAFDSDPYSTATDGIANEETLDSQRIRARSSAE